MSTTHASTRDRTDRDVAPSPRTDDPGQGTGDLQPQRPRRASTPSSRPWLGWLVVAVALLAATGVMLASLFGGGDQAVDAAAGSDVHLQNLAADVANRDGGADVSGSDQRLVNQAAAITDTQAAAEAGSDQHLVNQSADGRTSQVAGVAGGDQRLRNQAADAGVPPVDMTGSDQHLRNRAAEGSDS